MIQRACTVGAALLVLALTACTGGTGVDTVSAAGAGTVKEIKVVIAEMSKDHTATFWNAFTATYERQTGIQLNLQIISWNDIDQQTSTMVQNGNPPDILNLNAYASYARDGLLYDSDEVLSPTIKADILDAFVRSGTYHGHLYGFPDLSSVRALFYNKDLFDRAGIERPPATWNEFVTDAQKVTTLGDGTVGYAQPLGPEEAQAEFSIWTFNNDGGWKDADRWTINSPANLETLRFLKDLSAKYHVTQNNPGRTNRTDGAFPLFESGRAGMVVGFGPLSAKLDTEYRSIRYGIAPMPTADGGPPQSYGVTDYLMAFKRPGNREAVRQFYELYYAPEQINTWISAEGFLPVTKSGIKTFYADPRLKVYLDTLPNVHLTPTDDPTWDRVKLAVQQNLGAAVTPGGDPRAVLDRLQQLAESDG